MLLLEDICRSKFEDPHYTMDKYLSDVSMMNNDITMNETMHLLVNSGYIQKAALLNEKASANKGGKLDPKAVTSDKKPKSFIEKAKVFLGKLKSLAKTNPESPVVLRGCKLIIQAVIAFFLTKATVHIAASLFNPLAGLLVLAFDIMIMTDAWIKRKQSLINYFDDKIKFLNDKIDSADDPQERADLKKIKAKFVAQNKMLANSSSKQKRQNELNKEYKDTKNRYEKARNNYTEEALHSNINTIEKYSKFSYFDNLNASLVYSTVTDESLEGEILDVYKRESVPLLGNGTPSQQLHNKEQVEKYFQILLADVDSYLHTNTDIDNDHATMIIYNRIVLALAFIYQYPIDIIKMASLPFKQTIEELFDQFNNCSPSPELVDKLASYRLIKLRSDLYECINETELDEKKVLYAYALNFLDKSIIYYNDLNKQMNDITELSESLLGY